MKDSVGKITGTLLSVVIILLITGCNRNTTDNSNVVFILTDQWRSSAFGYAGDPNVNTPHLDQFAESAIRFSNAISVCPVCTPYRASILTGKYPTTNGMFLNDAYLPPDEITLAELYKEHGYHTAFIGKWHLDGHGRFDFTPPERRQGFDYWKALECSHDYNHMAYYEGDSPDIKYWNGYSPLAVCQDASQYIIDNADEDAPFFLFLSIASPHFPHHSAPEEFKILYQGNDILLNPNVPEQLHTQAKKELVGYYAHCSATDQAIGGLLQTIKELELMDNTIIVFTSDHGEMMGAHGVRIKQKQVPWIESAGVPLIIHYPRRGKNRIMEMAVSTPDISATLLELSGIDVPSFFEGQSFVQNIKKGDDNIEKGALYMSVSSFASVKPSVKKEYRALKTARYSYVKDLDGVWLLYDDEKDPYQQNNLAIKPENAELINQLDQQLKEELNRINDDFRPGESYLNEWGFTVTAGGYIPYIAFDQEPQMPKKQYP